MIANSAPRVLALDLGTTYLKASIIDRTGRILQMARRTLPMDHPQPGWAEQEVEACWAAVVATVRELASSRVDAIGIATQRGGVIFVDRAGRPISRMITWLDRRSDPQAQEAAATVRQWRDAGTVLLRGGPSALSKILWMQRHEPVVFAQTARVLISIKDLVLYRLVGRWVTDTTQASLSGLYDVRTSSWHPRLLQEAGVDVAQLPELAPPMAIAGTLQPEIASELGLPRGLPVAVGSGDAEAAHIGLGALDHGIASMNLGTIGAVRIMSPDIPANGVERLACVDLRPYGWVLGAMVRTAGALLQWLRDTWNSPSDTWEFLEEARRVPPGSDGCLFLPYLSGSLYPDVPQARGVLFGLTLHHTRAHVVRACLEGIGCALAEALAYLETVTHPCARIRVGGGGTQSSAWLQIIADICGRPLEIPVVPDASLLGAAILAGVGTGVYTDLQAAVDATVRVEHTLLPQSDSAALYGELRQTARHLVEHLAPYFQALTPSGGKA